MRLSTSILSIAGEVFLVDEGQFFFHVPVAVQIDIAVGRVIIFPVKGLELLVGQLRDGIGMAAGRIAVIVVREKGPVHQVPQLPLRRRISALHLVVHDPLVGQRALRGFQLVVPPFLLQDLRVLVDQGLEHRVQVDVHQVGKILVVAAGHRVDGEIAAGHGVEERVQRSLRKDIERALDGEILRTVQHRMLHDVRDAGIVGRRRLEGHAEDLVVVLADDFQQAGAAFQVPEQVAFPVQFLDELFLLQFKTMNQRADRQRFIGLDIFRRRPTKRIIASAMETAARICFFIFPPVQRDGSFPGSRQRCGKSILPMEIILARAG